MQSSSRLDVKHQLATVSWALIVSGLSVEYLLEYLLEYLVE